MVETKDRTNGTDTAQLIQYYTLYLQCAIAAFSRNSCAYLHSAALLLPFTGEPQNQAISMRHHNRSCQSPP